MIKILIIISFLIICNLCAERIMVETEPPFADIIVDGELKGISPEIISLVPEKVYKIILVHPVAGNIERLVRIKKNQNNLKLKYVNENLKIQKVLTYKDQNTLWEKAPGKNKKTFYITMAVALGAAAMYYVIKTLVASKKQAVSISSK